MSDPNDTSSPLFGTDKWTCGRAAEGRICRAGPDKEGQCQADFECRPRKEGDRWHCTRPDYVGGPCVEGPRPDGTCARPIPKCKPKPGFSIQRHRVYLAILLLAIGLGLVLIAWPPADNAMMPGKLSRSHALIDECGACHDAVKGVGSHWGSHILTRHMPFRNSELCISCHGWSDGPQPHNLPQHELTLLHKKAVDKAGTAADYTLSQQLVSLLSPSVAEGEQIACTACHQEHQGRDMALTSIADGQCEACHVQKFPSFTNGHPEFTQYPYLRRTRIIFDHTSHMAKHFKDEKFSERAPAQCTDCHQPDLTGHAMVIKPFGESCASCHREGIRGDERIGLKGMVVLEVPGIDVESLKEAGLDVGEWPEYAEGRLTPFMRVLLQGDARFRHAMPVVEELDWLDLMDTTPEELQAMSDLAWSVKELIYVIAEEGMPALKRRLEAATGTPFSESELAGLSGLLSAESMQSARQAWFPNLAKDIQAHQQRRGDMADEGDAVALRMKATDMKFHAVPIENAEEWSQSGGWYREEYALLYRLTGHADTFLRGWIDLATRSDQGMAPAPWQQTLLASLMDQKAPGACAQCHSIDADTSGQVTVQWHPFVFKPNEQGFYHFSHASHFSVVKEDGCVQCHQPDAKSDTAVTYKKRDAKDFAPGFTPVKKKLCAECHNANDAPQTCLTCHNYHVGVIPRQAPRTELKKAIP